MASLSDSGYFQYGDGTLGRIADDPLGAFVSPMYQNGGGGASTDAAFEEAYYSGDNATTLSKVSAWLKSDQGFSVMSGVTTVAGAVAGMATGYYSSQISKIQAQMQAQIAEFNQRQSERSAQAALMQSQQRIGQISRQFESRKASQQASMAANGIQLGIGSAAEVTTTTDIDKTMSINNEYANGYRDAWGKRMQGVSYGLQADAALSSQPAFALGSAIEGATTAITKGVRNYVYARRNNSYGVVI